MSDFETKRKNVKIFLSDLVKKIMSITTNITVLREWYLYQLLNMNSEVGIKVNGESLYPEDTLLFGRKKLKELIDKNSLVEDILIPRDEERLNILISLLHQYDFSVSLYKIEKCNLGYPGQWDLQQSLKCLYEINSTETTTTFDNLVKEYDEESLKIFTKESFEKFKEKYPYKKTIRYINRYINLNPHDLAQIDHDFLAQIDHDKLAQIEHINLAQIRLRELQDKFLIFMIMKLRDENIELPDDVISRHHEKLDFYIKDDVISRHHEKLDFYIKDKLIQEYNNKYKEYLKYRYKICNCWFFSTTCKKKCSEYFAKFSELEFAKFKELGNQESGNRWTGYKDVTLHMVKPSKIYGSQIYDEEIIIKSNFLDFLMKAMLKVIKKRYQKSKKGGSRKYKPKKTKYSTLRKKIGGKYKIIPL